ncbi:MAG: hypothetical protein V1794_16850 [Candidatus Glassbacteria bacterium]
MRLEYWLLILIAVVLAMAEVLRLMHVGGGSGRSGAKAFRPSGAAPAGGSPLNYSLAPRDLEVMAAALFELLSQKLNYEQLKAFAGFVVSPEMTDRYVARLAANQTTEGLARGLGFLCDSMKVNGFTDSQRAQVSAALDRKADKEYKLLAIHKNLDKIL